MATIYVSDDDKIFAGDQSITGKDIKDRLTGNVTDIEVNSTEMYKFRFRSPLGLKTSTVTISGEFLGVALHSWGDTLLRDLAYLDGEEQDITKIRKALAIYDAIKGVE